MVSTGSSGETPRSGYYPDPSIPGYIRYWDGLSWVPGTSRPEPGEGEPFPEAPRRASGGGGSGGRYPTSATVGGTGEAGAPGGSPEGPAAAGQPESLGEAHDSGDALPEQRPSGEMLPHEPVADWDDPRRLHGDRPQAANAWQPDAGAAGAGPAGPAGAADPRGGSWGRTDDDTGTPDGGTTDLSWQPNLASALPGDPGGGGPQPDPELPGSSPNPYGPQNPQNPQNPQGGVPPGASDTVGFRLPRGQAEAGASAPNADQTVGFRLPRGGQQPAPGDSAPPARPEHTVGLRRSELLGGGDQTARSAGTQPPLSGQPPYAGPPEQQGAARPPWEAQAPDPAEQPLPGGPGAPEGVTPWRPPVSDPFLRAAQQQARPAGLGRRLGARLVDALVVFGVTGAVAFPFVGKATDHVREQIDAAELAGETRQVWLVDGTTGGYLALVIGVFLLVGLLYEALPTARWGRTLGKRLFGVRVLDIEQQDTVETSAALSRWLAFSVLALLAVGVVNAAWCLFDRPWRQCWHDKLARTFLARD
ncbi:RDD family protein [Streptomyces oceani]|uniref:RDD domain-containing protein n=1 Tax=Streptomyces oceani TaxID=1075402 RepID=A0A1E7KG40_9ACTN|nr:RDD family protein [Streptomyces oceani]OEV02865.1 hypothetical protein AN216_15805 [Streptomyces oceani]